MDAYPFMDILFKREDTGSLHTTVFREPSHTDQYLSFHSHHPMMHKLPVIRSLMNRANVLCSTDIGKEAELNHVMKALNNKYPKRVIERVSVDKQPKPANPENEQPKSTIVIPYIRGTSDMIRHVLSSVDI